MLGKGLNLPITVEGIETAEILEKLMPYGEIMGQGYLYGHPQPAGATRKWLEARNQSKAGPNNAECESDGIPAKSRRTGTD